MFIEKRAEVNYWLVHSPAMLRKANVGKSKELHNARTRMISIPREEIGKLQGANEISPRKADIKLRKNEMKVRKKQIKVPKNLFAPRWRFKDLHGGIGQFP